MDYFTYEKTDAITVMRGVAKLLIPEIRAMQGYGRTWSSILQTITETQSDDVRLALYQLWKISNDPKGWIKDQSVIDAAGISNESMTILIALLPLYERIRFQKLQNS